MALNRKRLIVCCDGTWNWPDQQGGATNVVKMARAVTTADAAGMPQIVYYDQGVGTGNWMDRLLGGSFGIGLAQNVREAYLFLVNNYNPGDQIYLFGFSRGAFTVRSLAGLIGAVGLFRKSDMHLFPDAYAYYRIPPQQRREGGSALEAKHLGRIGGRTYIDIDLLGVWDTVGSLGVPFGPLRWIGQRLYNFHDTELGTRVRRAYQALAIDERRGPFRPAIWTRNPKAPSEQVIEQVWFAGVHSNVGGGYPDRGLADIAFLWMVGKAKEMGLGFDEDYIKRVTEEVKSQYLLVDSCRGQWRFLPKYRRPLCITDPESERIHPTAVKRAEATAAGEFEPYPYVAENLRGFMKAKGAGFRAFVADIAAKATAPAEAPDIP